MPREEAEPLLWVKLPATASSWTPDLRDCLVVEGTYAWAVRTLGEGTDLCSEAALFEVVSAEALSEVEAAIEGLLERRLSALGLEGGESPARLVGELRAAPGSGEARIVPRTAGGPTALGPGLLATTGEDPLELHVGGWRAVRYEPAAVTEAVVTEGEIRPNVIGGSDLNWVEGGVLGVTIGGGGGNQADPLGDPGEERPNRVTDHWGTVGGGWGNQAGDGDSMTLRPFATVGGGDRNSASHTISTVAGGRLNIASGSGSSVGGGRENLATATEATVAGGQKNEALGTQSFIGSGLENIASGLASTVCGGQSNVASGGRSTVPGGRQNEAAGNYSFAAGRRAKVLAGHHGTFVWSDGTEGELESIAPDEFAVRATGGVRFVVGDTVCKIEDGDPDWSCGPVTTSAGATGALTGASAAGSPREGLEREVARLEAELAELRLRLEALER